MEKNQEKNRVAAGDKIVNYVRNVRRKRNPVFSGLNQNRPLIKPDYRGLWGVKIPSSR